MTKIQWTDRTWNPVTGCTRVAEGCRNCYAERLTATRLRNLPKYKGLAVMQPGGPRWTNEIRTHPDLLRDPLSWRKSQRVFVCDMSDLFHEGVPFEFIDQVFAVMALCPHLTFQILTKRPERMAAWLALPDAERYFKTWKQAGEQFGVENWAGPINRRTGMLALPLPNVWLGTSLSTQKEADANIPHLLKCPAAVRFLSIEPLIEAVQFAKVPGFNLCGQRGRDLLRNLWIIVGGESGPAARPTNIAHIRSIVQQCQAAGVPCFVKQLGSRPILDSIHETGLDWPEGVRFGTRRDEPQSRSIMLDNPKGGDPTEWPDDLCVRDFPQGAING